MALRAEVQAIHGDDQLTAIDLADRVTGAVTRQESGGALRLHRRRRRDILAAPEIARDARGYVLTGADVVKSGRWQESRDPYLLETSVPGIFACGDVRASTVKRVAAAVGEGSMAIAFVHQYLAIRRPPRRRRRGRGRAAVTSQLSEPSSGCPVTGLTKLASFVYASEP